MTYDDLVPVIRTLALEAGDKIMAVYQSDDFDIKVKSDDSPVTEADEAADAEHVDHRPLSGRKVGPATREVALHGDDDN